MDAVTQSRHEMESQARTSESGMAIITAILVLMLASGLLAGMFAAVFADAKSHATDRDQTQAYAAAHAGLEKLTSNLGTLFDADFSPSAAQVNAIDDVAPAIPFFEFTAPGGAVGSGYVVSFTPDTSPGNVGNPRPVPDLDITTGPFEGLKGLITPYTVTVTARSSTGNSEVRLRREIQTVAVPVFQFGIFGEKSIGFHAGPNFDFGGRVHTNEKLFLASGNGSTLTFRDKLTAFDEVVRNRISNGNLISNTSHLGIVTIPRVLPASSFRSLLSTESSGTTLLPWTGWFTLSRGEYKTIIRTETTGAKRLTLPLVSAGATPIDLIKRPDFNENVTRPAVLSQRYYSQASLRILLSDRAADITGLPGIAGAPLSLDGNPAGYVVGAGRPPVALSLGPEAITSRASAVANAAGIWTLTMQGQFVPPAWAAGMPPWLTLAPGSIVIAGVPVTCSGIVLARNQFTGCGAHVAFANGANVVISGLDGVVRNTTLRNAAAGNSLTIDVNAFSTERLFQASKTIFVGPDAVTCTAYSATQLLGCTVAAGGTLSNNDPVYNGATNALNTSLLGGFIKIERQSAAGVWTDVTLELLDLGFADQNQHGDLCADPTPNAVIRLQRLRDNGYQGGTCAAATGNYSTSLLPSDFWPNNLFDAREGSSRQLLPAGTTGMNAGGIFSLVVLDANNLRRWFAGAIGATGSQAWNNNGYIVYFSDRRGDHNEAILGDPETGEYGFEDSINPAVAAWAKNNLLDAGENFNENLTLETYGETPHPLVYGGAFPVATEFNAATRPWTAIPFNNSGWGRAARQVLFRRALKVTNGGIVGGVNSLPAAGFTVTSENPIFIEGNYNATAADAAAEPNVPSALIGDSITLLSNAWTDAMSFREPNNAANRVATNTAYRFAMITGKTVPFPKPGWGVQELGSDGGVHNFMRMLEAWGGRTLNYRGSMVSLFFSRQAVGIYRADSNTYGPPTRGYNFDSDFLSPPLLPPGTPMFRDINTLKFRQILRPNQ